ncbi:hypothetical protein LCGC14_0500570 [marine sediment metagenome]|uniref:Uncharacterized protein n=1 Tax=marine sediment metagenome TaxID=412755 RepID=A0A0F9VCR9_9ZZZZ
MANEILQKPSTQINWGPGGATYAMTLLNMLNNVGRMGVKHDNGAVHATRWRWYYTVRFQIAPTFGNVVEIHIAYSHDNTLFDGEHTGTDAAMASAEQLPNMQWIGNHICRNNAVAQWSGGIFHMQTRYCAPLVYNISGQQFTNAAAEHELILEPIIDEIQ